MTESSIQSLANKLKLLGNRVGIHNNLILFTSDKEDSEGYNTVTLYIVSDDEIVKLIEIPFLDKFIKTNTKLIVTGKGKPRQLILGLDGDGLLGCMYINQITKVVLDIDTSNISNMSCMFHSLEELKEIEFKRIDTHSVEDMSGMFWECKQLKHLELNKFDTTNLRDMSWMFYNCLRLSKLDISSFKSTKLTHLTSTFQLCKKLVSIDLSGLGGSSILSMDSTFMNCEELQQIDISNFDLNTVENFNNCFNKCCSLLKIIMPPKERMKFSKVTSLKGMFKYCSSLEGIDLSPMIGENVESMQSMFEGCTKLKAVILRNFRPTKSIDILFSFGSCIEISYLDIRNLLFDKADIGYLNFIDTRGDLTLILHNTKRPNHHRENKVEYNNEIYSDQTDILLADGVRMKSKNLQDIRSEWGRQAKIVGCTQCNNITILHPVN